MYTQSFNVPDAPGGKTVPLSPNSPMAVAASGARPETSMP